MIIKLSVPICAALSIIKLGISSYFADVLRYFTVEAFLSSNSSVWAKGELSTSILSLKKNTILRLDAI